MKDLDPSPLPSLSLSLLFFHSNSYLYFSDKNLLEYKYECGKVRMVNGNSNCCRPFQGDLDLHRERERLLERDALALISLVHMVVDNWLVISF